MKGLIVAPLAIDQADPLLPVASDNARDSQWRAASVVARDLECPANLVQMAERVADQQVPKGLNLQLRPGPNVRRFRLQRHSCRPQNRLCRSRLVTWNWRYPPSSTAFAPRSQRNLASLKKPSRKFSRNFPTGRPSQARGKFQAL